MRIGISVGNTRIFKHFFRRVIGGDIKLENFTVLNADLYDLVLFTGGADVSPELYGEINSGWSATSPYRDRLEVYFLEIVRRLKIPHMGICRGHQFLNAMYGGKLIQHLITPHFYTHDIFFDNPEDGIRRLFVNSTHHQAVKKSPFDVLALAQDGTIEMAATKNILTMQFHPESYMTQSIQDKVSFLIQRYLLDT